MDWRVGFDQHQAIGKALAHAATAVGDELEKIKRGPTVA